MTYKLKLFAHWKIHFIVSIQQLESTLSDKNSYDRKFYDNLSAIYMKEDFDDDVFYEIEKLINKRIIRKKHDQFTRYLMRWKEYDLEHDTWYKIDDLKNAAELVIDYERNSNSVWYQQESSIRNIKLFIRLHCNYQRSSKNTIDFYFLLTFFYSVTSSNVNIRRGRLFFFFERGTCHGILPPQGTHSTCHGTAPAYDHAIAYGTYRIYG